MSEKPAEQDPEKRHAARVAFFATFLRSGGVLSLREWLGLPESDIRAFADAGALISGERAGLVSESILSALATVSQAQEAADPLEVAARKALAETAGRPQ